MHPSLIQYHQKMVFLCHELNMLPLTSVWILYVYLLKCFTYTLEHDITSQAGIPRNYCHIGWFCTLKFTPSANAESRATFILYGVRQKVRVWQSGWWMGMWHVWFSWRRLVFASLHRPVINICIFINRNLNERSHKPVILIWYSEDCMECGFDRNQIQMSFTAVTVALIHQCCYVSKDRWYQRVCQRPEDLMQLHTLHCW